MLRILLVLLVAAGSFILGYNAHRWEPEAEQVARPSTGVPAAPIPKADPTDNSELTEKDKQYINYEEHQLCGRFCTMKGF